MFGKRILILVAHPDDEVVMCAASIAQARAAGATVSTLYLTNGCISAEDLWPWQRKDYSRNVATRRAEGENAALFLGVQPVGWSSRPARHLWRSLPAVYQEVETVVSQLRPDQIWVPAYEGGNPDHDALNAIGFKFKTRLSVLEFAEYNFFGGKAQSHIFVANEVAAHTKVLSNEERANKRAAMAIYGSEQNNLTSVDVVQECYRPLSLYDYTLPPHQGILWYARFRWVPFQHPRIDRANAADISKALSRFL